MLDGAVVGHKRMIEYLARILASQHNDKSAWIVRVNTATHQGGSMWRMARSMAALAGALGVIASAVAMPENNSSLATLTRVESVESSPNASEQRISNIVQTSETGELPLSLCRADESVVFSCRTLKGKLLSLCASQDASVTTGYLAYRFGQSATSPELEYPNQPSLAKDSYRYRLSSYAKATTVAVSFWVGQYRYSVFRTTSVYGYNGAGVIVNRGEDAIRVTSQMCEGRVISPMEYEVPISLYNLGKRFGLQDTKDDVSVIGPEENSDRFQAKPGEPEDWRLRKKY